jgi:ABC-type lipoprotein export system ATPase subunit
MQTEKSGSIRLDEVYKRYKAGDSSINALNNVSLLIKPGEFVVVMGPSGSGKTTLLNTIAGLTSTTEGHVYINEKSLQKLSDNEKAEMRRHEFGFIFQFYNLHEGLTAQENVELPMLIAKTVNRKERSHRSKELLEMVGLELRINQKPFELSGGERQRVGIARALANDPPIILADEPTGDLDSKKAQEILELLYQLNKKMGKTFVMVTHDYSMLKPGMRLLKMDSGQILSDNLATPELLESIKESEDITIGELATH